MLQLKGIKKDYEAGGNKVTALHGIDIAFRKSEFVSVLGPSGCGKTTLLNIIGGLDRYTEGDLIISGRSTKEYKDRDWDYYRNHAVGFVFQNYNLIPHQTVLSNVELALTLSGVGREQRRKKATEALEKVGLGDQLYKKPNEMSGGQMQRVAIARALVNDPEIILADEPTGALDTQTSVQIMELLKEISENRLVIMVTHNPDLAEKYSSRIIRIIDGKITDDSNPCDVKESVEQVSKKTGKTSMGFLTALSLSLNNLMTKKGRTLLTSFAGSIGIIGIALILSLSSGMQSYIDRVEEDTLSSYPITLEKSTVDMSSMVDSFMKESQADPKNRKEDHVYSRQIMKDMLSTMSNQVENNNLKAFKRHLEKKDTVINENANAIQYQYDLNLNLYRTETKDGVTQVNPSTVMDSLGYNMTPQSSMMSSYSNSSVWEELIDNEQLLHTQYDVLKGHWPKAYNEVVLMVDENNEVSDYMLYSLGLLDQDKLASDYKKMLKGKKVKAGKTKSYSFDELLDLKFKLVLNTDYFVKENGIWADRSEDEDYLKQLVDDAEEISIVGIIRAAENSAMTQTTGSIGYTKELTEYVINEINSKKIVKEQKKNKKINVFTGLKFNSDSSSFSYDTLSDEQKMYLQTLSDDELATLMQTYADNAGTTYEDNLSKLGVVNLEQPSRIHLYPKDFEAKENIAAAIENYNNRQTKADREENAIHYTDIVGTMISSMTTIVDVISYVLIAFVAISLIVSSIMIGIITYISVLERTKEIGILRAIGSSKKDISRVFRAETVIEGFAAGVLGIGITVLLDIPINMVIKHLYGISGIASLPVAGAVILVVISVFLTMIAGLMPSKVAAKKDPVVALRTE